jgi:cyanophycinase
VYVVDGSTAMYSNVAELEQDHALSLSGVALSVLSHGDTFDLERRSAQGSPEAEAAKEQVQASA